jgi:hypothetical protein
VLFQALQDAALCAHDRNMALALAGLSALPCEKATLYEQPQHKPQPLCTPNMPDAMTQESSQHNGFVVDDVGNVKPLFDRLLGIERTDRVQRWQDLLSYVITVGEAGGSKDKLGGQKRAFDVVNAEKTAFENAGGGGSSTDCLDTDAAVNFKMKNQYVGVNEVWYDDKECFLFNWASTTKNTNNVGMAALVDKATWETIARGRSLEGDIASHNLCVISDPRAITELQQRFDPDREKNHFAFAIGGDYRDPTDPRGATKRFDGIHVMGLLNHRYKSHNLWSAVQWKRLQCLLKGDHAGAVEVRSKCIRKRDNLGIAEFDGQSALTYFQGQFFVYARANPREAGYRTVQVCHGPLDDLSPFQLCTFEGVPDDSDIYFLHPYVVPGDRRLAAIMSLVWPERLATQNPAAYLPGIYLAFSQDGLTFRSPVLLHTSGSHDRRAYDLPVQGDVSFT